MPPERKPSFSILETSKRDAVIGIDYANPDKLNKKYWKELLQRQVDCNGKRELTLTTMHSGKRSKVKIFKDLRRKMQGLPEEERNNSLSRIIVEILQAKQVLLIETNEKSYIPIDGNGPQTKTDGLSNAQLYSLIGDLPSLDTL